MDIPWQRVITTTSEGNLGGRGGTEEEIKDRFEAGENPCDRCRWWTVTTTDFPCSCCTHNNALANH